MAVGLAGVRVWPEDGAVQLFLVVVALQRLVAFNEDVDVHVDIRVPPRGVVPTLDLSGDAAGLALHLG
jgi:hypothetical protein